MFFKIKSDEITFLNASTVVNICIKFAQRRPNVPDVSPTLCKSYADVLCLLGSCNRQSHPINNVSVHDLST